MTDEDIMTLAGLRQCSFNLVSIGLSEDKAWARSGAELPLKCSPISITFPWCGLGKPEAGPVPYSPETLSDSRGLHFPQVPPVMGRKSCHCSSACCVHIPSFSPFCGGTGPCYLGSKELNQWVEDTEENKWQDPVSKRILGSVWQDCKVCSWPGQLNWNLLCLWWNHTWKGIEQLGCSNWQAVPYYF